MVKRNSTNNEPENVLDETQIGAEPKPFSVPHGLFEVRERKNTLKTTIPENLKTDIIANVITMKSAMTIDKKRKQLVKLNRKCFSTKKFGIYRI